MIARERLVWRELELHEERAQKKERAERRVDEIRVLPEPAESRSAREVSLEQRARIHVRAPAHIACPSSALSHRCSSRSFASSTS